MLLSDLLGRKVVDAGERRVGRVCDLAVDLGEPAPRVCALLVRERRRGPVRALPWSAVAEVEPLVRLESGAVTADEAVDDRQLRLAAHVLDRQVFDARGMHLCRVGDLELAEQDGALRLVAAEVGTAALLRRVGLQRLSRRLGRRVLDWHSLHITSGRGHALQLESGAAGIHRASAEALAALATRVPGHRADEVLRAAEPSRAARARTLLGDTEPHRRGPLRLRRRAPS